MIISLVADESGTVRTKMGYRDSRGHEQITHIDPPYDQPRTFPRLVATIDLEFDDTPQGQNVARTIASTIASKLEAFLR